MSETEQQWMLETTRDRGYWLTIESGRLCVSVPSQEFIVRNGGGDYGLLFFEKDSGVRSDASSADYSSITYRSIISVKDARELVRFAHLLKDVPGLPEYSMSGIERLIEAIENRAAKKR